ncbi:Calx-beta domain-containing protein [Pedosphaera parvula]|uniref:Na-Ca exchanger/integrin-beta4 n=1 Tax=Pedosphaera parvula (strain Ellin514) TaxID=320771 RepID=B9XRI9_PEDPL|nr:Calx-beta domain-containing protein [Pedosphaera parvula]EEF57560.1 Na-Ca exchanger/integrin-beta4 [Pedosphaera parvula Ellin514]
MKSCGFVRRLFSCLSTISLLIPLAGTSFGQITGPIGTNAPGVTIEATDPSASEAGDPGVFTVYRSRTTTNELRVFYVVGGTASNGVDYVAIPNSVVIPPGANSAQIVITPIDDQLLEGDETVVLHLANPPYMSPDLYYLIGNPSSAAVVIHDNDISSSNKPPVVTITSPMGGATYPAPANITLFASAFDSDGSVTTVEFFEGANSLGIATNNPLAGSVANPFHLSWPNVSAGQYILTAVATDNLGATGTSSPVNITVKTGPITNPPPVVSIVATDPIAVENPGTNHFFISPVATFTNYYSGTNTATFLVRRIGDTNTDLTVYYDIGGTASNGVDYVTLPGNVTIPAGKRFALITINPLEDLDLSSNRFETVILSLHQLDPIDSQPPVPYFVGSPGMAEALILEESKFPWPVPYILPGGSFYVGLPATNGLNFCVQISMNMVDWTSICTNTVVKDGIHFIDTDASSFTNRYYRVVPASAPPVF